jgi:sialic acid synthase SpsE
MEITIGKRHFDQQGPLYFIADIGANHDGDLDRALKLIELAKEAGADAAKFQNFKADKIVSKSGFSNMSGKLSHQANWKKPVFEIYQDASISQDWTAILKKKCDEVGIDYFTSAYDYDSVDHVTPFVDVFKIGSGDITWTDIIQYTAKKGKPVIVATGASSMEDVERAMQALQKETKKIVLMQCNTNYTGSAENFKYIHLNVLKVFAKKYPEVILGLSDHTTGHATVLGAIALGATFIEKHFTDDNGRSGPDHAFAMNPQTWRDMVDRSNELFLALGTEEKKIEDNEKQTVLVQQRGLRYTKDLPAGHIITEADLFPLRPYQAEGLYPYETGKVIGKKLLYDVTEDQYTSLKDLQL